MRKPLWLAVAMLLVGVGCPSEFGMEGRIEEAIERDTEERLEDMKVKRDCPAGMHREKAHAALRRPVLPTGLLG